MKQRLRKFMLLATLFLPLASSGQVTAKLSTFATAVAHAEGFGVRRAIHTRYHNPGDLKCNSRKAGFRFAGMRGVGKGGHAIFKSDAAGWAALRTQIVMILDGRSRNFNANMTINEVAKVYARNWHRWATSVSKELGVPPTTTVAEYFALEPQPPVLATPPAPLSSVLLPPPTPISPILVQN